MHDETGPANSIGAHWGRWDSGSTTDEGGTHSITAANQFHYLYGPVTPPEVVAAKSGSFAMNLVGGTTPTNNNAEFGTFIAAALTVDFTARTLTVPPVSITGFTNQSWSFNGGTTPIRFAAGKGAFIEQIVSGSCTGSNCSVVGANLGQRGIFMGPNGDHLGIAFQARTISGVSSTQTTKIFSCSPSC